MKIEKSVIDQIVALQFSYIGKDPVESRKDPFWRTSNQAPSEIRDAWNRKGIEILMEKTGISKMKAEAEMSWIDLNSSIKYE